MLATCPSCGCDLQALLTFDVGPLTVENGVIVSWGGKRVPLTPSERTIVVALARADGAPVKRWVLAEVTGYDGENGENLVAVLTNRIMRKFRAIDPGFAAIETVRGAGLRWKTI